MTRRRCLQRAAMGAAGLAVLAAVVVGVVVGGGVGGGGCARPDSRADQATGAVASYAGDYPFRVVTTTGMLADIVRQVAGERGEVVALMGEGIDPHLYRPTRHDVSQLMAADIVFYSGLMLEGRMADTLMRVARSGRPVYAVTEGIDESYLLQPEEFEGHDDPHVWMDVAAWSECVAFVAETFAAFDPRHADEYHERAQRYRAELAELDAYVRDVIAGIPASQRVLVTAHDAFGYFSRAYDIPVHSVQGLSTEAGAGVDDINRLVDLIVERRLRAIFLETSVPARGIRAVIEGAGSRGWRVEIGGELYSDAMGAAGTYEGTYVGMIDHNATTISRALGGDPPEGGWRGVRGRTPNDS